MTTTQVILIVGVFLLMDGLIVTMLVKAAAEASFGLLAPAHPSRETVSPSSRRNFCSMRVDWFNLGGCVHIEVDSKHLHLHPAAILRWAGARPASVPWDSIEFGPPRYFGRYREARIGRFKGMLPAWCAPEQPVRDNPDESGG